MSAVRVRFAPSPTGFLHLGGARTALFNWLWARRHSGAFVLRIEDTDRERSTRESTDGVLEAMRWLGLTWDEGPGKGGPHGPYVQSERLNRYREYAEELVKRGHAFRCYATKEEIQAQRTAFEKTGQKGFRFVSPWRDQTKPAQGPYAIRFRAPTDGQTTWDDLVRGQLQYPNNTLQDAILLRSDGLPLYNFGAVVDDLDMGITLVARGDDHMVNTPYQLLLYEALDRPAPQYAHLPMILGPDGQKLSKRHASVSVNEYQARGYLPAGMLNYLARLGWSHGDQELFSVDELVAHFDWKNVGRTGAKYDAKKLSHVQSEHLRGMADSDLAGAVQPFLAARDLENADPAGRLPAAIAHVKLRCTTLEELADGVDYFVRQPPTFDEKATAKFLKGPAATNLGQLADTVSDVNPFDVAHLETAAHAWMEANQLRFKDFAQAARVALTGRTRSPGLFEVMEILGQDRTISRLRHGASLAAHAQAESPP